MPTLRPRKRARSSSLSSPSGSPATITVPVSARSSPAMTISRVDFPDPEGPMRPIASPLPILRAMSLRIWTLAASCPSERLTPANAMAGLGTEGSFMNFFPKRSPSYGKFLRPVQLSAALLLIFAGILGPIGALAADKPVKIVVLGDSLSAGYGLAVQDAFPSKLQAALTAKGYAA